MHVYTVHVHAQAGHLGVLFILCLHVCTVQVWCIGSGFSFFTTNFASVLYIHMYFHTYMYSVHCVHLFSFAVVQFATGLSTLHQVAHVHTGMADCVCACGGTPYSGRPEMRIFRTS